mmetsp:Transcript_52801/g.88045  ORF Transcript_52801/g.88045 Transcript_52801/m.88045 type:complete len:211 (-) Transcript_52801:12-644(-)
MQSPCGAHKPQLCQSLQRGEECPLFRSCGADLQPTTGGYHPLGVRLSFDVSDHPTFLCYQAALACHSHHLGSHLDTLHVMTDTPVFAHKGRHHADPRRCRTPDHVLLLRMEHFRMSHGRHTGPRYDCHHIHHTYPPGPHHIAHHALLHNGRHAHSGHRGLHHSDHHLHHSCTGHHGVHSRHAHHRTGPHHNGHHDTHHSGRRAHRRRRRP